MSILARGASGPYDVFVPGVHPERHPRDTERARTLLSRSCHTYTAVSKTPVWPLLPKQSPSEPPDSHEVWVMGRHYF